MNPQVPAGMIESTTFEWGNPMPAWLVFLFALGLLALVVQAYRRESGGSGRAVRSVLAILRLALVFLVLALITEPQFVTSSFTLERSTVAIVVDRSRSMSLSDRYAGVSWADDLVSYLNDAAQQIAAASEGDAPTRDVTLGSVADLERMPRMEIARLAARALAVSLAETHNLVYYAFDSSLARDALPDGLAATGAETHLGDALEEIKADLSGRPVSGIVVFTDGQSNGGVLTPEAAADRLGPPDGIPVYTVGIGDPTPPRDVWISDLHAPERALKEDTVVFDFVIGNYGFSDEQARVELEIARAGGELGRIEADVMVRLGDQRERTKEQLRYTFREPGEYVCTVRVREKLGEIDTDNNIATHFISVIDRRIKVLYVEGYPRWEYRALWPAMTRDRSIEVYCLLQSADPENKQVVSDGFEPLRRFPEPPASDKDEDPLFDFDVIILGDVDLDSRGEVRLDQEARQRILTFVESVGGGVVLLSGNSFNPVDFEADDSLRKLLPVVLEGMAESPDVIYTDPFWPELTPEGMSNPILRLRDDMQENKIFIEGGSGESRSGERILPPFYWYYPTEMAKPTATVLATHPTSRGATGRKRPLMTMQQIGKGKVFWSATDEIWRWRRSIGDKFYYRFWGQVIRSLAQGKLLGSSKRVTLYTNRPEYTYGEKVEIYAEVLDRSFKPVTPTVVPDVEVTITSIDSPDQIDRIALLPVAQEGAQVREGVYSSVIIPRLTGTFRIELGDAANLDLGEGAPPEATYKVREPAVEMENPFMDRTRLEGIAARSGKALPAGDRHGMFLLPQMLTDLVSELPQDPKKIPNESVPPIRLWHRDRKHLLILLVLIYTTVLSIEWVGRKLSRML